MRTILLFLASALPTTVAVGQAIFQQVVVYTFESTYKNSLHGKDTYYWIIPVDSLQSRRGLSPLLGEGFSINTLERCCAGEPIAPAEVTTNSSYDFAPGRYASLDSLAKIIAQHRRRIQKTITRWQSGQVHHLAIFATPVFGVFCSAKYDYHSFDEKLNYKEKLYIPLSKFKSANGFWLSKEAKIVALDFSPVKFDLLQNLSRRPWSK